MEPIVVIVGFLGAGKTTLLKQLAVRFHRAGRHPYVILNDYLDADLDGQQIYDGIQPNRVTALTGSCICCDGIDELRDCINSVPPRNKGITLIEANGTSDASLLMGFLGVGLAGHFRPPVQVSVIDVKNWQRRGSYNELEAEQVKVATLLVLTHCDAASKQRVVDVRAELQQVNPRASVVSTAELDVLLDPTLAPIETVGTSLDHAKTHWSAASIDLPPLPDTGCIQRICDLIPSEILRIKGCTRVGEEGAYIYFERCPDGELFVRPYAGALVTGPKLLTIGPGSTPALLENALAHALDAAGALQRRPRVSSWLHLKAAAGLVPPRVRQTFDVTPPPRTAWGSPRKADSCF